MHRCGRSPDVSACQGLCRGGDRSSRLVTSARGRWISRVARSAVLFAAALGSASCLGKDFSVAEDAADLRALDPSVETVRVRGLADEDVGELQRFHQVRHLDFTGGWKAMPLRLTAAGFARLAALELPNVQGISLAECPSLDDASLQAVARLDGLSTVGLRHSTGFSPLGLRSILDLPALTYLDLRGCSQVDDTWGDLLATGTQLRHLGVTQTHMTPEGVARLRMALPDCFIDDDPAYINAALDRAQYPGWAGPPERKGR